MVTWHQCGPSTSSTATAKDERGHDDRLEHLARALGPRVLGYLARRARQPADAADLFAEVLLIAWRRIDDVPVADEEALPWLLGVARRVAANQARGA